MRSSSLAAASVPALLLAWGLASGPVAAQTAEAAIAKVRAEIRKDCDGKITFKPGFQKQIEINGDGRPDYVLDYGQADCVGGSSAMNSYCGSAGCTVDILVSGPSGYRQGWGSNLRGWSVEQAGGAPVLVVDLHGSACGKSGAEACRKRFTWNGSKFVPAARR